MSFILLCLGLASHAGCTEGAEEVLKTFINTNLLFEWLIISSASPDILVTVWERRSAIEEMTLQ